MPEEIGGVRNWDYRFCWLRDATFTLYALAALGYSGEARRFGEFVRRCCQHARPRLQIMYGIEGELDLTERTLDHLEGYRGSRPVRTGNAAFVQQQLDIYGEILDWAYLQRCLGARFEQDTRSFLRSLADFVLAHWAEPDHGIWEMRGPPRHHVHGKIMSWVALDRALRLFGDDERLREGRDAILRAVRERGIDPENGHLCQAFERPVVDAALLTTPFLDFPLDRDTLERTVEAVRRRLGDGDYLQRYVADDGLEGGEGAFLICNFWLVDALLFLDRPQEARSLFERLCRCANDVGLYSEEIDPATGASLGNFPQAFTHLALIHSASLLALHDERGPDALRGTHADRAAHAVEATSGWRALWAAFKRTGRVGRLRSSRASILDDA